MDISTPRPRVRAVATLRPPGYHVETVGMTKEQLGAERVAFARRGAQTVATVDDVARVRALIESFIAASPGDATAISAGLALVAAERAVAEPQST